MQQYFEVRRGLPRDTLLLFRLGDFFEMFFDDAVLASRLLGLTLTKRQDHPMAGIPAHACDNYVSKLLAAGKKVAICDQAETAQPGRLVKRQLTRILSPGTMLAANQLDAARNHYLCAVTLDAQGLHASWLDLSTGEFRIATDTHIANLLPVLTALDPAELLVIDGALARWAAAPHDQVEVHALHAFCTARLVTELSGYHFETATGAKTVMDTLGVLNLQGASASSTPTLRSGPPARSCFTPQKISARSRKISAACRNTAAPAPSSSTRRRCATSRSFPPSEGPGRRRCSVRSTVPRPHPVRACWSAGSQRPPSSSPRSTAGSPSSASSSPSLRAWLLLRERLASVRDIPRILGRLQNRLRNPRELGGVRDTLTQIPAVRAELASFGGQLSTGYQSRLSELPALRELLTRGLADELPNDLAEGNYIRTGYDPRLDELRMLTSGNKTWLADLERGEQERTGIRSLKVRFTNNFGYYIEITKANLHLVPSDYIRRQTTVGGERYVTEALKAKEKEIFHAEENALARELELFNALVAAILDESVALAQTADALAELDVLAGWAVLAREWNYCRPALDEGDVLSITEGRHPVVEQMLKSPDAALARGTSQAFVPNDTLLACDEAQVALITGPNMAGKSTYIRQVALITLLAQVGCWVPAKACRLGLVDRIFSRVGASDDLARGNSTFMVEMNETANILNNATSRSLIILDEIGRGTSTYDGLSIAWAVVEHLHRDAEGGPRTLFATHYQELTQLEKHLPRLRNFSVAVKEWNDEIVFVRRVSSGAADRSYGIQVARLAGLPLSVIDRAKTILGKLESDDVSVTVSAPQTRPKKKITVTPPDDSQLNLL